MRYLIFSSIPFEHEPYPGDEEMVNKNLFGNNIGNSYFFNAVIKTLRWGENEVYRFSEGMNLDDYDMGILIQANQIRDGAREWIDNDYNLISKCKIPFVIVCVGTDSNEYYKTSLSDSTIESIRRCYNLILERTTSIGVRGEWTKKVLVDLVGIPENRIDVIGCPSIRYYGKYFEKKFTHKRYADDMKIAVNYTAYHYNNEEAIYLYNILKKYKNSYVVFTDKVEADMLWNGKEVPRERYHDLLPSSHEHFIVRENRARFVPNQKHMMQMLKTFDFSIGSRIHQTIISILSGCPAMLIAHSQRVLEIAEYHHIPYVTREELIEKKYSLEELYYKACYEMKTFYDHYEDKLFAYTEFLEKNGIVPNPIMKIDRSKYTLSIFGDCVSQYIASKYEHARAEAGINWASIFLSNKFEKRLGKKDLETYFPSLSNFVKRTIVLDSNKTVIDYMLEKKADMFLLDANDCRHHLLSVDSKINKDSKVLTLNEGIEKNSLEKIMGIETEINEINSYEVDFDIYKNAVKFIINQIQTVYKDDEIIVHEHLPVYEYLDSDGKLVHLKETAYYCENVNELLLSINEEIKKLLPRSHYIEFPNNVVCGENKWGISPLHYHSLYYEYGEEALKIILEKRDNEKELLNSLKNLYSLKFQRLKEFVFMEGK